MLYQMNTWCCDNCSVFEINKYYLYSIHFNPHCKNVTKDTKNYYMQTKFKMF